jgi:hypothetical protein
VADTIKQVVMTKAGGFDVLKVSERTKFAVPYLCREFEGKCITIALLNRVLH